jgi:ADP-glucose pyrophosphorylase
MILMGDSLLPFTAAEFMAKGAADTARVAAYQLKDQAQASQFGVIEIGNGDVVRSFEEKPAQPRSAWVFTGCLYLPKRLAGSLNSSATAELTQFGHLVAHHLHGGERITVFRTSGEWHDIGTVGGYLRAHRSLLSDERREALLSEGNHLSESVYVHPSAVVSGSRLRNCVISAGARIIGADLTNCVVQPQVAIMHRAVRNMLVTTSSEFVVREV